MKRFHVYTHFTCITESAVATAANTKAKGPISENCHKHVNHELHA